MRQGMSAGIGMQDKATTGVRDDRAMVTCGDVQEMLAEGKECFIGDLLRSWGWDWGIAKGEQREEKVYESQLGSGRCGCDLVGVPAGVRDRDPATSWE